MTWRSPYHDEDRPPPSRVGQWISRGVLLVVGVGCVYLSVRGMSRIYEAYAAAPSPWLTTHNRRTHFDFFRVILWLFVIGLGLLGLTMTAAACLSVTVMQSLFERWHRPPVTGESGIDDESVQSWLWRLIWGRWW